MNVRPTNSGTIVQARAQVLIGSFEPLCPCACTFLNSLKSTNGPFLVDLLIMPFHRLGAVVNRRAHGAPLCRYLNFNCPYRRERRRRTIAELDALRRCRVNPPLAGFPVGLTGWRPPFVRPSPPPCG